MGGDFTQHHQKFYPASHLATLASHSATLAMTHFKCGHCKINAHTIFTKPNLFKLSLGPLNREILPSITFSHPSITFSHPGIASSHY